MNKDIIDFLQNEFDDENLEEEWEPTDKVEYVPPDYLINNGIARYLQLAQIMAVYYHAKHSEPMSDVFENVFVTQQFDTEFHI